MRDLQRAIGEAVAGCAAEVRADEPMAQHTTFRIGGPADAWVRVNDKQALVRVLQFCRAGGVRWWLLGRGSNVLVSDQGLRGVVISLGGEMERVKVSGADARSLSAGAGAPLDAVATFAEQEGLAGVEFLAGIPGTIGGGLHSNAGAFGRSLGDVISSVTAVDRDGNERELAGAELRREYRRPMIDDGLIAIEAAIQLQERGQSTIPDSRFPSPADVRQQRRAKHPKEPSAGSFFRNPGAGGGSGGRGSKGAGFGPEPRDPGTRGPLSAGALIEQCGLKGKTVGGARVSEKHANFLVNTGGARFADVYELVQIVKATVEQETGILLEEEVQYLPGRNEGRSQKAEGRGQKAGGGSGEADGR